MVSWTIKLKVAHYNGSIHIDAAQIIMRNKVSLYSLQTASECQIRSRNRTQNQNEPNI